MRKTKSKNKANVSVTSVSIPRNYLTTHAAGVQQNIRRTLSWSYYNTVTVSNNTYVEQLVVVLNSPYDPDSALGGTSATGFAKYMALYSKCFSLAARMHVKVVGLTTQVLSDSHIPVLTGLTITTNSTSLGNPISAIQAGLCVHDLFKSSPDRTTLTNSVDVGKFMDIKFPLNDGNLFCTSSSNPNQLLFGHFWTFGISGSTVVSYIVDVEFDCVFTDPIPFS